MTGHNNTAIESVYGHLVFLRTDPQYLFSTYESTCGHRHPNSTVKFVHFQLNWIGFYHNSIYVAA